MKNGGSAFPEIFSDTNVEGQVKDVYSSGGMTMRQYYKAAALQGMVGLFGAIKSESDVHKIFTSIQLLAPKLADAMLAEDAEHEKAQA